MEWATAKLQVSIVTGNSWSRQCMLGRALARTTCQGYAQGHAHARMTEQLSARSSVRDLILVRATGVGGFRLQHLVLVLRQGKIGL